MNKRRLFVVVLLGVLVVTNVTLWARSLLARDVLSYTTSGNNKLSICSYLGRIHFMRVQDWTYGSGFQAEATRLSEQGALQHWGDDYKPTWNDQYPAPIQHELLGFAYLWGWMNLNPEDNGRPPMVYRSIVLPYWFSIFLFICLLALSSRKLFIVRRQKELPNKPLERMP